MCSTKMFSFSFRRRALGWEKNCLNEEEQDNTAMSKFKLEIGSSQLDQRGSGTLIM